MHRLVLGPFSLRISAPPAVIITAPVVFTTGLVDLLRSGTFVQNIKYHGLDAFDSILRAQMPAALLRLQVRICLHSSFGQALAAE